jgi:hypothetical protein
MNIQTIAPTTLRLNGSHYDFIVTATPTRDECWFELCTIHRASGESSVINTVNAVMSVLLTDEQDATDARWSETPWGVSPNECARLVQSSKEMLTDPPSLLRIEDALDEDRAEGEWRGK